MVEEFIFSDTENPKTLLNFLKKRFPIGYVRKLFRKNSVRLNGKRVGPETLAGPGDRVQLYIPYSPRAKTVTQAQTRPAPLEVLFEDETILLISKPAGLSAHEGKEVLKRHSLSGLLEAIYKAHRTMPSLVHRLDRETSGIMLVAKRQDVAVELERLFEQGEVEKEYMALIVGRLPSKSGKINLPLPGRNGKPVHAVTRYHVDRLFSDTTLVRVATETGRMHQIRLHFAKIGHPIVLDKEHGDFPFNKRFRKSYGLKRQFLHAHSIAFPYRGKKQKWTAPLPDDLAQTLRSLESHRIP